MFCLIVQPKRPSQWKDSYPVVDELASLDIGVGKLSRDMIKGCSTEY